MFAASVTLLTYTRNDHTLVYGLLASLGKWTVRPWEIIVVDDGSATPFVWPGWERLMAAVGCCPAACAGAGEAPCVPYATGPEAPCVPCTTGAEALYTTGPEAAGAPCVAGSEAPCAEVPEAADAPCVAGPEAPCVPCPTGPEAPCVPCTTGAEAADAPCVAGPEAPCPTGAEAPCVVGSEASGGTGVATAAHEPFAHDPAAQACPLPEVRVLRNATAMGNTATRSRGVTAATSRFVLAVDADIRLPAQWLQSLLPVIARPEIGMAATPIRPSLGTSPLGRYMALTYTLNAGARGSVGFLPGGVWIIRREVWQAVGGFAGYASPWGQDAFLSARLLDAGYQLWVEAEPVAAEVRPITRLQMVRRGWRWHGHHMKKALDGGRPLEEACNVLLHTHRERVTRTRAADPALLYFDLLYLLHALADMARHKQSKGATRAFGMGAQLLLQDHPAIAAALSADLTALQAPLPDMAAPPASEEATEGAPRDVQALLASVYTVADLDTMTANLPALLQD